MPSYLARVFSPENLPNIALVIVGIGGIITAIFTLRKIDEQAREMRQQRIIMRDQLSAIRVQVSEMAAQRKIMGGQLAQMKESGVQTESLIEQTAISAAAAKLSADIATGVSLPTLVVTELESDSSGAADFVAILQFPTIRLVVKNYGQTPALLHSWTVVFTREELLEVPIYFDFPGSGMVFDKVSIQPNESFTLPKLTHRHRQQFSLEDVKAIITMHKVLTVYGYVAYSDIFGNPLRRMKFSETALNT